MTKIQKLICPECKAEFEFDPDSDATVITSLNKSLRTASKKEVEVTAYLDCPNGHNEPYKVKKTY
jgi:hypothetical protein